MTWFRNLKTVAKLMIGFACTGLITALIGWIGLGNLSAIHRNTEDLYRA